MTMCCGRPMSFDEWEDCYLCLSCGAIVYPEPPNPDAGWRRLKRRSTPDAASPAQSAEAGVQAERASAVRE